MCCSRHGAQTVDLCVHRVVGRKEGNALGGSRQMEQGEVELRSGWLEVEAPGWAEVEALGWAEAEALG